jgi:hypothetical protein
MVISVNDPGVSEVRQVLPVVMDSSSKTAGNMDGETACGPRKVTVEDLSGYPQLSYDEAGEEFVLTPVEESIGTIEVVVDVSLADYP